MSNDWGNDWNTDQWNTGYSKPQHHQQQQPPAQNADYGGDYYSQNQGQANRQPHAEAYNSGGYSQQQSFQQPPPALPSQGGGFGGFQTQQFMSDPMLKAAQQFGGQFAEQQKEKLTKYLGTFNLKYYFAVDNSYVGKKLFILFFPFFHRDWSLKFGGSSEPYPAREDVNAPDLYIPLMAFLTYILVSGFVLGTQGRFSPEILGILTTNALIWVIIENFIIFVSKYVMNISQALSVWHSLAYSTYKFVGYPIFNFYYSNGQNDCNNVFLDRTFLSDKMIFCLLMYIGGERAFYLGALAYSSFTLVIFLLRSVSHYMFDASTQYGEDGARKRKLILVLFVVITQPLIMWWLTSGVTNYDPSKLGFAQMALGKLTGGKKAVEVPLMADGEVDYEALLKMHKSDYE